MNKIEINLRQNFKKTSYVFGYSQSSNIQNVTNWQDGINSFDIQNDGIYYFFARHKKSGKISMYEKTINCGGARICAISFLNPYQVIINTGDIYEIDWSDGSAIGVPCQIIFLTPYLN